MLNVLRRFLGSLFQSWLCRDVVLLWRHTLRAEDVPGVENRVHGDHHCKEHEPLIACSSSISTSNSWDWIGHGRDEFLDVATSVFRHSYIKGLPTVSSTREGLEDAQHCTVQQQMSYRLWLYIYKVDQQGYLNITMLLVSMLGMCLSVWLQHHEYGPLWLVGSCFRHTTDPLPTLVSPQIAQKYDPQKEEELRYWIEEVTGMPIGENFQMGLKDGVILCDLINKLQPGSIKKINNSKLNWHKLENLGNFIKAILAYGLKPTDVFEANDLFENGNMTQVQTTLLALASMAKTKGLDTKVDIGVKYADKQHRNFDDEKMKAGNCVIGLQMGTNKCASQAGMTAYGTRRHLYDPKTQTDKPYDQTTISLQMGTNKGASQAGMAAPGTRRDIFDQKASLQPMDNTTISLQMGTNKAASQKGMSVYGLGRQIYDPKYCASAAEAGVHSNGSQGTRTNSEISDTDYQAEYQGEYQHEYQPQYQDEYRGHYDQGIDY
ncbi:hypothetical protein NFI96_012710 [Prochilodus magdalenae]|nr:hypothetical protein NFI96_012710 [Prochilodus magdalenae]